MARIKPAALLRQSKKQKAPARPSVTSICASLVFVVMVVLSIAFIRRQNHDVGPSSQYAVLNTTKGLLTLQISGWHAPITVEKFLTHSHNGDYNGWKFHKVMNGLIIQGGDQGSNGVDNSSVLDAKINDETGSGVEYEPFTLIEESLKPGTNNSRFVITTTGTPHFNPDKHTVIGRFVGGQSVLQDMEYILADNSHQPMDNLVIYNILLKNSL